MGLEAASALGRVQSYLYFSCVLTYLVCILQLQAGDDLSFQLRVVPSLVQDVLAEFGNISLAGFAQDWV